MKRRLSLSGTILVTGALWCFACNEVPTASAPGTDAVAPTTVTSKKPPTPGGNETPLIATFDDHQGGLVSDGAGAYVHGQQKVRAVLRTNGNLNFDAAELKKNQFPERFLCITVIDNSSGAVLYPGSGQPACVDATLNTHPREESDAVLAEMAVGETAKTTAGSRWWVGDTEYRLKFGRECGTATLIPAHKATATHPTADSWTLEGGDQAMFCSATRVKGKEVITVISRDARASFHVTLVKQ